ncbi:Lipid A biosynthesis lauroyl acyltransferase [Psychrobacter pasteurii]|uniref:Lipid A biosynthesis lauroyl acyltransferase n=1 Tax=Psychrobacter pasteurii TaxID=1945520 RepID=A0A1R4EIU2_9GAMM|nr:lysophospholipid acyltransferase family protein [Psychrobacter pasteurii]SJM38319.1 Lipid A biosynthesis lauroyl acyltransferase [Psychrobacter pasteurii]
MNPLNVFRYVPLSVMRAVALFVAWIAILIPDLKIKRTIRINLRLAFAEFSEEECDCFTKAVIKNQALIAVESIKCWAMPPEWSIAQIDNVYNKEVFDEALANPNGMLAIVPHLGTWEMMNAWINQFGSPTILYKPTKNETMDEFILEGRQRLNATLVPTDASGVKAIFKTLKSGGFSIILPDHVPQPSGGVIVPFFGIETLSSTLAPKLASKTKCALVGLSCLRNDNNGFDIYCTKLDDPDLYARDMNVATKALNDAMEQMIRVCPSNYMWSYRRFKHLPNLGNPYKATNEQLVKYLKDNHIGSTQSVPEETQ